MSGAFELNGGQENGSLTNFIQFLGCFVSPLSGHIAILTEDGSAGGCSNGCQDVSGQWSCS